MMNDIERAHEHVSQDACYAAMTAICGMSRNNHLIFVNAVKLCLRFDDMDWVHIENWLREQWHNGKPD